MKAIDLQPLNSEQIQKLGLSRHDLWIVKLGDEVFGPFEPASLRDYAAENEELFNEALASRLDAQDWHPFFSYALFQRRSPQLVERTTGHGPFWIMEYGLKVGPLNGQEIEKRIEMGTLGLTDIISVNDGHSWQKIYQLSAFDRRFHTGEELPTAPQESDLQEARLDLLEKIESGASASSLALAEMTHIARNEAAKAIPTRLDDVPFTVHQEVPVSSALKWFVPGAAVAVIGLFMTFKFMSSDDQLVAIEESPPKIKIEKVAPAPPVVVRKPEPPKQEVQAEIIAPERPVTRKPASVPKFRVPRKPAMDNDYARESQYPTHVETHNNNPDPIYHEEEPYIDPRDEYHDERVERAAAPRPTHSLVKDALPAHQRDDIPLDAAMNGDYIQPEDQMVDEYSDF